MDNQRPDILACERLRRHCRYSIYMGIAVWWGVFFLQPAGETWTISLIMLFVPLVLFRVAFPLLLPPAPYRNRRAWYVVSYAQPPAAVLLAASFALPRGDVATLLAIPWLLFALFLAGFAIYRIAYTPRRAYEEWGPIAAMLLLPVGAGWAVLFQAGIRPVDFSDVIVLLTATHFHYAGFVLPVIAGQLVRLRNEPLTRGLQLTVIAAVPLVAVGITASQLGAPRGIEMASACVLAGAAIGLGLVMVAAARRLPALPGLLLGFSGFSLVFALSWSIAYAAGRAGLLGETTIPFMVNWHGAVNALGFALCGLLGWHFLKVEHVSAARIA